MGCRRQIFAGLASRCKYCQVLDGSSVEEQSPWYNFDVICCVDPELWGLRVKVEAWRLLCGVKGIFHAFVQATKLDAHQHQLPR